MRIQHFEKLSFIQGRVDENEKILAWIERAKKYEPSLWIGVDESDEYETSYTVVGRNLTQKERQEAFQNAKRE